MREVPDEYIPVGRHDIQITGRPTAMPTLNEGEMLVCEYIRDPQLPSFNLVFVCETVEDMQQLFDACNRGGATLIRWYAAVELVRVLTGKDAENWLNGTE